MSTTSITYDVTRSEFKCVRSDAHGIEIAFHSTTSEQDVRFVVTHEQMFGIVLAASSHYTRTPKE